MQGCFGILLDDEYLSCVCRVGSHKFTLYNITGVFEELSSALDILQTKSFAESSDIAFLKQFVSSPATTKLCEVSVPICYTCVSTVLFWHLLLRFVLAHVIYVIYIPSTPHRYMTRSTILRRWTNLSQKSVR